LIEKLKRSGSDRYPATKFIKKMTSEQIEILGQEIEEQSGFVEELRIQTASRIVGQHKMIDRLLIGLLSRGHILLEGMPGLAKTLAIKTLATAIHADFSRIQFTPDLLPSDILGTMVFNPGTNEFSVKKGPVFANFILADEINRAPAKVQSALLELMQERQVTIGQNTYKMQEPFLVLATQNPIEQEGTYPLPEAQVDRFMLKVKVAYPTLEEERTILRQNVRTTEAEPLRPVVEPEKITEARSLVEKIYMDERIEKYILDIVFASRNPGDYKLQDIVSLISFGASPRATINLALAAKALAFLNRRAYVLPDDVRSICVDVMNHRIGLSYEAEAENISQEALVKRILEVIPVP
jgi:MoxR-like ATPase